MTAIELVREHGWNATSFQALEDGFDHFFDGDGFVAYVDTGTAWVAAGAPITSEARLGELGAKFCNAAKASGRVACFFGAAARFADASGWKRLQIGEEPLWDPRQWNAQVQSTASLRKQLHRAHNKGVKLQIVSPEQLAAGTPLRVEIDQLLAAWLATRSMAPMGFLVDLQPFSRADERLLVVAKLENRVIGLLSAVPIYARRGWFFENLVRVPSAPNGTIEVLVNAAMLEVAARGAEVVSLGMAPLAGPVPQPLRSIRAVSSPLYDFQGLREFKNRLRPDHWDPVFLLCPPGIGWRRALLESLRAFARGSLLGFGVRTFLRGPPVVIAALTVLLAVWIPLLALAPSSWFPHAWVQTAWVVFDLGLLVGLGRLWRRFHAGLATLCAALVSIDAVLTLTEAATFNLGRGRTAFESCCVLVACCGPIFGAVSLWGLVRRSRQWSLPR